MACLGCILVDLFKCGGQGLEEGGDWQTPSLAEWSAASRCGWVRLHSEMYSGGTEQISPHMLLYAVWKVRSLLPVGLCVCVFVCGRRSCSWPCHARCQSSAHMAGYSQQDAHEFFITLLDVLHSHLAQEGSPAGSRFHLRTAGRPSPH